MRILYFTIDSRATVEKTRRVPRLLEMPDGYHPVTNDSVWVDAKRLMEPLLVVINGVRAPYGGTMEKDDVSRVLFEIEVDEKAFKKPPVSKLWMRSVERLVQFFVSKGLYIGIIVFILVMLAQSLMENV